MKNNFLNKIFNLDKKVVVISGACGQLGKSFCNYFINTGSSVIGVDREISQNKINNVDYFNLNVQNGNEVETTLKKIYKKYNKIDIIINNAGVSTFEPFEERSEEKFDWVTGVNIKGPFNIIQKYVKLFDENNQNYGNIINISSIYGIISPDPRIYGDNDRKNSEIYGASKAALIQMTKYFGVHLANRNIRCNSISPGGIFNPKNPQNKDFIKKYSYRCPMERMGEAHEISGLVLFLSSDASSYINGQNITVDGGMSSW